MTNIPVRNLGGAGVISDIHAYDLPLNAISAAVNVRFENGTISRAPVFRKVFEFPEASSVFTPSYMFSIPPIVSGAETFINVSSTFGVIKSVTGLTEVDVSAPSITGVGANNEAITHTFLGNVAYLNRVTSAPLVKRAGDATFITLPNWAPSDRTRTIRAFKDFVLALNVTKAGVEYPSMVKWSDITGYGSVPGSWDPTITTNSAGENILSDMQGPILDGRALRDNFFIYGRNEVWAMSYIGGTSSLTSANALMR
ncbi:hypothetical protein D3Y57_05480 [Sphingomonas paeninsulae]|uniref:Uncharacterized protein n=1 Tax=Sphingomonas paeninsulae TaxID=2319844 RepID=A0A494TID1_SPHPE|nr:hypothetical protein [Sphingomonas paeninsulae]AYJ85531.1 hypothetical protein D3Y57_05480 [Sphingomonas paeninsulae]